jgi:hypothetical protein
VGTTVDTIPPIDPSLLADPSAGGGGDVGTIITDNPTDTGIGYDAGF